MMRSFRLRQLPKRVIDGLLMQPWVSGPLHVFGNELDDKKWVFVIGCYNSGTTLLAEMLQTHSEMDGMRNEGAFLTDSLPYPERLGWPRMWAECEDKLLVPVDDAARARRIRRHWSLWVRGNPRFVVEKSIANALRVEFLWKNFPAASFVHIVRNGYAVAAGIRKKANLRRWKNPRGFDEYPIDLCAGQWLRSLQVVEAAQERGAPVTTIRYEDLVADPVGTLSPIFSALDLDPITDATSWGKMQVHERSSTIKDMNAASIRQLTAEEIGLVSRRIGDGLRRYGYEAIGG